MINYANNAKRKEVFYKRFGENSGSKAENLFLLGKDWQNTPSQKNQDGQLPVLAGRRYKEIENPDR